MGKAGSASHPFDLKKNKLWPAAKRAGPAPTPRATAGFFLPAWCAYDEGARAKGNPPRSNPRFTIGPKIAAPTPMSPPRERISPSKQDRPESPRRWACVVRLKGKLSDISKFPSAKNQVHIPAQH